MLPPNVDTVRPGTRVLLSVEIEGRVTATQVRAGADGRLYLACVEVCWWDGWARSVQWLEPWEITPLPPDERLGF